MWTHDGLICTGETYKHVVKMTFAKGAALEDPTGLFNSSLDGNTRRAIDFQEGGKINEQALTALIRAAVRSHQHRWRVVDDPSCTGPTDAVRDNPRVRGRPAAPALNGHNTT